jgi:hypothetical protein
MKGLNLFPHRELALQRQVTQFQRDLVVSAIVSLLLAVGVGAMVRHADWLWPSSSGRSNQQMAFTQELERRTGVERARQWLETLEPVKIERRQRLQVLRLLNTLTTEPVEGVFLGQFQWTIEGIEVDLWAVSPESVLAWLQRVQTVPGFDPTYNQEALLDAAPNPLGLPTYRVRIQMLITPTPPGRSEDGEH